MESINARPKEENNVKYHVSSICCCCCFKIGSRQSTVISLCCLHAACVCLSVLMGKRFSRQPEKRRNGGNSNARNYERAHASRQGVRTLPRVRGAMFFAVRNAVSRNVQLY